MSAVTPFSDDSPGQPFVRGFLHAPAAASGDALVLTHGAGSNCQSPLLIALAAAFADAGIAVLRCDLAFRLSRPHGPPMGTAAKDQQGLRRAVELMKPRAARVFLGGHSYGGRQASMLAASEPGLVPGLLLLSYPLHPPRKPEAPRTAHFPNLQTPSLFVHGSRDPFGSLQEMTAALKLIPARTHIVELDGAGHELIAAKKGSAEDLAKALLEEFQMFFRGSPAPSS